jgi:DNA-binding beta-propeller fold protein YncE
MTDHFDQTINRFWDDLAEGHNPAVEIEPESARTITGLHSLFPASLPVSARERARQRVFHSSALPQENTMTAISIPISTPPLNGTRAKAVSPPPLPHRPRYRPRFIAFSIAAIVLLLLAGIGAYLAIVPAHDRLFGGGDNNHVIPAAQPAFDPTDVSVIWETRGTDDNPLKWPVAVAIAPDGNIYVANASPSTIEVFSPDGEHLESWGEAGEGPGQFTFSYGRFSLADLEFDGDGNLFVFDSLNGRIQKFAPDHTFILEWGMYEVDADAPGEFDLVMGGVDSDLGLVYASDRTGRIQVFDLDGNYQYQWGSTGVGPGEFTYPWDVDVVDGRVFIVDEGSIYEIPKGDPRVQEFDSSGALIEGQGALGSFFSDFSSTTHFIEFDPSGRLFVADYEARAVRIASDDGRLIDSLTDLPGGLSLAGPSGMAFDDEGNLYLVDDLTNLLIKVAIPPGD